MVKTIVYRGGEVRTEGFMARPKGSKNKRSVGIPEHLKAELGHRDPADVLGEIYSMPHDKLAAMMRSAKGARAVAIRMQAAIAAMPYQHSKMPVQVTVNEDQLPTLNIYANKNSMQNQRLINSADQAVGRLTVGRDVQDIEINKETDE
jgi:hypothetical protein